MGDRQTILLLIGTLLMTHLIAIFWYVRKLARLTLNSFRTKAIIYLN